jgi:hypothetical protein
MVINNNNNQVSLKVGESSSKLMGVGNYDTKFGNLLDHESSISPNLVNSIIKEDQLKPIPSRIDYNFFNYCSTCELKYPKQVLRCKDCNQKVRTRPWHRSKIIDRKRI